jgi:hypothetical protein
VHSPEKLLRKVPAPLRILDAPDIVDDYYLNLISWKDNILAVSLVCICGMLDRGEIKPYSGREQYVT